MLQKLLVILAIAAVSLTCLTSCKKRSEDSKSDTEAVKTTAEYQAEAKEQINEENMAEELGKIETAIEKESQQE